MKIYKAYAKVNTFLKITGLRGDYHEIISRFMRVDDLYDELSFEKKDTPDFKIIGSFSCTTEQNTIYKAYNELLEYTKSESLDKLMQTYAVKVDKNIPAFAGLGGGSSDAATYLKMCNEVLHLNLSIKELAEIGLKVGADVPFFIYGYDSANVSGIGEIVEPFDEPLLKFDVYTPNIEISTPKVYKSYRDNFFNPINSTELHKLKNATSIEVLESYSPEEANDLFNPALKEYPKLKKHQKDEYYFSGSGSSFFRVI
ncbi:4-(cytidine 5'-diphospho)-2-C-methyl-D-erythritol kinase [Sulfurimonas lithotrophica]|uniref:4-diphosphocytidyl-2-C-methyl-D-erythritol kinase n=1 Tax=Sulfurimonas lithotrophica TaxID=2590022 RepID=A0A5P8NZ70_9BACT|nr:4-(cytidine 5'-diphospho)-2-C-methyl-D-erythritol kinase [Sulfurimonas lithotrophica]QFR48739.1 4-(cytidine 5'-diphospho)-2-C-methyl-D-erythritol kinase [Sulfurimonas lithotrophica]